MKNIKLYSRLVKFYLLLNPLFVFILALQFKLPFISTILLYYLLPIISLFPLCTTKVKVKGAIFSLVTGVIIGTCLDFVFTYSGIWWVSDSVFNFRLLNQVPVEDILWGFSNIYLIVLFYEVFFDKNSALAKNENQRSLWLLAILTVVIFSSIYVINPELLFISQFYWIGGVVLLIIPMVLFFIRYRKTGLKIFLTGLYFFYLSLLFEIGAVFLGHWGFYGDVYLLKLTISNVTIPFEEFFFFIVILAGSMLVYYEFYFDDRS